MSTRPNNPVRVVAGDSGAIVAVSGDVDLTVAPFLEEAIASACEADPSGVVVVDLSGAAFLDSRAMGVLATWTERQRAGGGRLPVVCTNPDMLRIIQQIGLDQALELVASLDEAAG